MASYAYTFTSGDTVTPTKLNNARTVSEIVNADIKSDAAIAGTKIAPDFGSQNIVTTGNLGIGTSATSGRKVDIVGGTLTAGASNSYALGIANTGGANADVAIGSDATYGYLQSWGGKPLYINSQGNNVYFGTGSIFARQTANITGPASFNRGIQTANIAGVQLGAYSADAFGESVTFVKSRGSVSSPHTAVQSGDTLGTINFAGSGGASFFNGASIIAQVDGSTGSSDMPARLTFWTTPDGSASTTERMRITSAGDVGIGTNPAVAFHLYRASSATYSRIENGATADTYLSFVNAGSADEMFVGLAGSGTSGYLWDRANRPLMLGTNNTERVRVKSTGQVRFQPLSADPSGAEAGDVYYNSSTNKLKVYNGTSWVDLH